MTVPSVAVVFSASLLETRYKPPPPCPLLASENLIEHHSYAKMDRISSMVSSCLLKQEEVQATTLRVVKDSSAVQG